MSYYFLLSDMFMKRKRKKKNTAENARQKIETTESHNIYSFQMCDTFMKNN